MTTRLPPIRRRRRADDEGKRDDRARIDDHLRVVQAQVEKGMSRITPARYLPPGGDMGDVLVKKDARDYNAQWIPGVSTFNVQLYGATGDGVADDTAAIQDAIDAALEAGGGVVYFPRGVYKITAALTYAADSTTGSLIMRGEGSHSEGSVISNTTNNVRCLYIDGAAADGGIRVDRYVIEDLRFIHHASSSTAIVAVDAPYLFMSRVVVHCANAGHSCLFLGTTTVIPDSDNFLSVIRDCDFRAFNTGWGARVNSSGHTILFDSCKVGGGGTGSYDGLFESEGVTVRGGQWGGSPMGVVWDNGGASEIEYGRMQDVKLEGVGSGESGVTITGSNGTPRKFNNILIDNITANMNSMDGSLVTFDHAGRCKAIMNVRNPTLGSGVLCTWTENSDTCELVVGYDGARADLSVSASAVRPSKTVTGLIAAANVANITVYPNLRTTLADGVEELTPGHIPVHNGVAWNFGLLDLADDTAGVVALPSNRGRLVVMMSGAISHFGEGFWDADASPDFDVIYAGADFETTTGTLSNGSGNDTKTTVSVVQDALHISNRAGGTRRYTVLLYPADY